MCLIESTASKSGNEVGDRYQLFKSNLFGILSNHGVQVLIVGLESKNYPCSRDNKIFYRKRLI